jgi:uncharacterized membrane protein
MQLLRSSLRYLLAAVVIAGGALFLYQGLLFPRDPAAVYPWSSDAWGHLIKGVYLRQQISEGNLYPDIFPSWYSGQQMLRYFAPLPYYLLAGLFALTDDIWRAGNLYLFLCALAGGLSFLLFARRLGLVLATVGGILYLVLPDSLRVAFAEGNLPRTLAVALLPAALYFLLNVLEYGGRRRDFIGLAVMTGLVVLTHAMMAGIFILSLGLLAVSHWLFARGRFRTAATGAIGLGTGLAISAWWMFPSLTGGITELDQAAASEAIAQFPVSVALNPGLRGSDSEIFYVGLSLVLTTLGALIFSRRLEPWAKALLPVAVFITLVGSTLIVDLWRALPAHQLFWPLRFMSFAGLAMLLVSLALVRLLFNLSITTRRRWMRAAALVIPLLLLADFQPSIDLIRGRGVPAEVQQVSEKLRQLEGWRVATADLSRLGSAPAMLFTSEGGREQVFGWAYQGSITAPLLARVNQSMAEGHVAYSASRYERLGADDIVLLPQKDISPDFGPALERAGYRVALATSGLRLYHKDGEPRAVNVPLRIFGIGAGANNLALVFPEVVVGTSPNINDYDPAFLDQFEVLVLSRYTYETRGKAEEVIKEFAGKGKKVVVDLTAAPLDALSREPKLLGVYGEPVIDIGQARLLINGVRSPLLPFETEFGPWRGITPQGAQEVVVPFEYLGAEGVAVARNKYGAGEVYFIGLNLMFHAAITDDPLAIRVLEAVLDMDAGQMPTDVSIPLRDYTASQDGWRFRLELPAEEWVLLPMAHHDGTRVVANGREIETVSVEYLTLAKLPAGTSSVHIKSERTRVYVIGLAATGLGALVLLYYLAFGLHMPRTSLIRPARTPVSPSGMGARSSAALPTAEGSQDKVV